VQYGAVAGVPGAVSRCVLGTAAMTTDRPDEAFALLDRYLELGGNGALNIDYDPNQAIPRRILGLVE